MGKREHSVASPSAESHPGFYSSITGSYAAVRGQKRGSLVSLDYPSQWIIGYDVIVQAEGRHPK